MNHLLDCQKIRSTASKSFIVKKLYIKISMKNSYNFIKSAVFSHLHHSDSKKSEKNHKNVLTF